LHHDDEYPFNEGRLISDDGLDIAIDEFENHFKEMHIEHSTALHCLLNGKPYLVGPLARLNLNAEQLPDEIKKLMSGLKVQFPSKNMFHSIIARAIELFLCILEAEKHLLAYERPDQAFMEFKPKSGTGYGCTEAPRGFLWHRYDMDEKGRVKKAIIVPPTSQNQPRIEQDLKDSLINFGLENTKDKLRLHAEKVIRNYDPCISCATHFLNLKLVRNRIIETDDKDQKIAKFTNTDLTKTGIIGIGSPHEGDDLGWRAIDKLLQSEAMLSLEQKGLTLLKLDRPGLSLAESIRPYDHVVIIDAIRPDELKPSFICLDSQQLISGSSQISSHETGLVETVTLLESLQLLPERFIVIGISSIENTVIKKIINLF